MKLSVRYAVLDGADRVFLMPMQVLSRKQKRFGAKADRYTMFRGSIFVNKMDKIGADFFQLS